MIEIFTINRSVSGSELSCTNQSNRLIDRSRWPVPMCLAYDEFHFKLRHRRWVPGQLVRRRSDDYPILNDEDPFEPYGFVASVVDDQLIIFWGYQR